jgi:hypothetical protein
MLAQCLEPEGHAGVAVGSHRSGEQSFLLLLCHAYLVVPRVRIQKTKEVTPRRGIYNLVDAR